MRTSSKGLKCLEPWWFIEFKLFLLMRFFFQRLKMSWASGIWRIQTISLNVNFFLKFRMSSALMFKEFKLFLSMRTSSESVRAVWSPSSLESYDFMSILLRQFPGTQLLLKPSAKGCYKNIPFVIAIILVINCICVFIIHQVSQILLLLIR